jgi:2-keto-4-pentenoate hydratase/2-oxohepta-3-ene-1,7-dioic acid hydratase in catechol pathway
MKLIRFGAFGEEKPGIILPTGEKRDVSAFGEDFTGKFWETDGLNRLKNWLDAHFEDCPVVPENIRLGACVAQPSKIVCVGLNYANHAKEAGLEIPEEPILFLKAPSALCGPNDDLILPKNALKTDWEVELAFVIGRKASYIAQSEVLDFIVGYTILNDYSERSFQFERGGQWVKGKSNDRFAPLGPYLLTKEEVIDPQNLPMWLRVNGEIKQQSTTKDMIFGIREIVSYVSQFMTLMPGDVISTGTPFGVGMGSKPPRFLQAGDVVELGIDGLGEQKQRVVAYE